MTNTVIAAAARTAVGSFNGYHMGVTAENVAKQWQLTHDEQDQFALAPQHKAEAAQMEGRFQDEITPVTLKTRKGDIVVEEDEYIRHGATLESMQKLRPAFNFPLFLAFGI